jgi:hypothetical protein
MTKKPPTLPNIEDATLVACLAPLVDAMNANVDTVAPVTQAAAPVSIPTAHLPGLPHGPSISNDNPVPAADSTAARVHECCVLPRTLAEWRSLADDDFGAFRMIEHFLGMTDTELETVAAEFPRQIAGTVGRILRLKKRLAARYDAVTSVVTLLERAISRTTEQSAIEQPEPMPLSGD